MIHSHHFYNASWSLLLLRSDPDTARILSLSFTPKRHRQLPVKDLPKAPIWRLERDSNPRPSSRRALTQPMLHHVPQRYVLIDPIDIYYCNCYYSFHILLKVVDLLILVIPIYHVHFLWIINFIILLLQLLLLLGLLYRPTRGLEFTQTRQDGSHQWLIKLGPSNWTCHKWKLQLWWYATRLIPYKPPRITQENTRPLYFP